MTQQTFSRMGALLALLSTTWLFAADEPGDVPEYAMTGEGAEVDGLQPFRVEGIGLVVGLKGTGSDPPNNNYRKWIMEIIKKKNVYNPAGLLASPDTAVVLLRAYIPPGARKGDAIDVEVWVPPGDDTTSLKGGYLLEAEMKEHVIAQGEHLKTKGSLQGDTWAKVEGPVLVMEGSGSEEEAAASLKKGKVLGRGRMIVDRDFRLLIKASKKSKRHSDDVANAINHRFKAANGTASNPIAKAKTDQMIVLRVPREYQFNVERFLHVVRRIPMSMSATFRERLQGLLEPDLMNTSTAIEAALRLEAIGPSAKPVFEEGLLSDDDLVQFCSAQSLAYLKDPAGFKVLAELADRSSLYRAYALAALIAHDHPIARTHLTRLLESESAEGRYGAFRSLWMLDAADPSVRPAILGPDQFALHLVESQRTPMIHVSQRFRRELVLFGRSQQIHPPFTLQAGPDVTITAEAGSQTVHLYATRAGAEGTQERRLVANTTLADVIRKAADLGATYPDIVDLLMQASQGGNLMGQLKINALPAAPRLSDLDAVANDEGTRRWRDFNTGTPSLFDAGPGPDDGRAHQSWGGGPNEIADADSPDQNNDPKKRSIMNLFRRSAN